MKMRMPYRLQLERDDFLIYLFHLWILSFIHSFLHWNLIKIIDEYNVYYLEHSYHGWLIPSGSFTTNNKYEDSRIPFIFLVKFPLMASSFLSSTLFNALEKKLQLKLTCITKEMNTDFQFTYWIFLHWFLVEYFEWEKKQPSSAHRALTLTVPLLLECTCRAPLQMQNKKRRKMHFLCLFWFLHFLFPHWRGLFSFSFSFFLFNFTRNKLNLFPGTFPCWNFYESSRILIKCE